jgi:uncharacterized protein YggL (DUF469 family)
MINEKVKYPLAQLKIYNFPKLTREQRARVRYWLRQQINATLEEGDMYAPIFTATLKK